MNKNGLISYNRNDNPKCEVRVQAKMTVKQVPQIERNA